MILYSLVAMLTVALASQIKTITYNGESSGRQRMLNGILLSAIFTILTLLAALRMEVGNDYGTYVVTCHEIFQNGYVVTEPGYNLVVKILYTLSGKEDYLLMFAVFAALINIVFIKSFKEQSASFALSFFLFMTLGVYYRSFNTVRYYFALAITLYSLRYVVDIWDVNKKAGESSLKVDSFIKFVLLILFAASFHKSVLVVLPIYLVARLRWNKWIVVLVGTIAVFATAFQKQLMDILLKLYPSYENTVYIEEVHNIKENLPVIARCILVLVICLICYKESIEDNIANRTYFNLNLMAIVLYISCWWMPLVTRIAYYMITPQLLLLPGIVMGVRSEEKKRNLIFAIIFISVLYFIYFLYTASNEGIRVLPYKSWLFYDHYWLNQTDTF